MTMMQLFLCEITKYSELALEILGDIFLFPLDRVIWAVSDIFSLNVNL